VAEQLSKLYDPENVEKKWYKYWKRNGYFRPDSGKKDDAFVIVIPPPNVTGILTMGHVLNNTLQDILVRYARLKGHKALWLPGTDHAGIATQNVVEKQIRKEGKTRHDYGREKFVEKVWDWANHHKSIIFTQLEELGSSFDRDRERFTLDDGLSQAVRKVFVHLYKKGLIYKGRKIINWCPVSQTALSDEEVIHKDTKGHLWYFKYPLKDRSGHIIVATTRPETMLGDTGVAVNPKDKRYKDFLEKELLLPIQNRIIPIIEDEFVDPEFGTGAVKVTPAHDPNDFEMGERHGLKKINVMNTDGTMNKNAGAEFDGLDRFEARKLVVKKMTELGYLEKVEDYDHSVGFSERAGVMIEPYLSEQWFVKMEPLAEPAIKVVEEGKIKFHPARWVKTYNHWMINIKDWCISRQLWWGHRIPVFYCNECDWQDALLEDPKKCPKCGCSIRQETDVLDTWFSSWLWPFSTMGWPKETEDLKKYYPTDDLVTAPDIIFFWVARMIMAGLEFMGEIPFKDVYFTGMIRDMKGRKMSKSLGNSPNPLHLIEKYGADALRYGVMLIAPQGQDILFNEKRLEVGRNFMNKVWNASRFILMNIDDDTVLTQNFDPQKMNITLADKWILSRLSDTIARTEECLQKYRFDEVARVLYDFAWNDFCDWYIELIKDRLYNKSKSEKDTALSIAVYVLKSFLKILHPYAPFITEEIFQKIKHDKEKDMIVSQWPENHLEYQNKQVDKEFTLIQEVITALRTARSETNIPPSTVMNLVIRAPESHEVTSAINTDEVLNYIRKLVRIKDITISADAEKPHPSSSVVVSGMELFLPLKGVIDLDAEKARLEKDINNLKGRLKGIQAKLQNQNFVTRAPEAVVAKERQKEISNTEMLSKLEKNLKALMN